MRHAHLSLKTHAFDFWYARGAIALIAGLQLLFVDHNLIVGPRWLAPALELILLAPFSIATAWTQSRFETARSDEHWRQVERHRYVIRWVALLLTALVMVINLDALISVTRALLQGGKIGNGK